MEHKYSLQTNTKPYFAGIPVLFLFYHTDLVNQMFLCIFFISESIELTKIHNKIIHYTGLNQLYLCIFLKIEIIELTKITLIFYFGVLINYGLKVHCFNSNNNASLCSFSTSTHRPLHVRT